MVAESYDLAIEHFAAAATAMERSIQDALRAHAERAKTRAFGLLEEVGDHVEPSEPKLKAAKERLSVAQTDYDAANFATSIVLFDEAATLLGELQEKIAATRAEQGMKDALTRAFAAGISGELGELAVGLSHRTTGEQRQAENKSGEARIAFELATKAFEQAIIVELEIRALRARDATAAVRKSVTGSGAAPLERFARANEQFDKATAALTLGNYEAAYEIFRRAQNGFDQAALEWAANKAAGAAGGSNGTGTAGRDFGFGLDHDVCRPVNRARGADTLRGRFWRSGGAARSHQSDSRGTGRKSQDFRGSHGSSGIARCKITYSRWLSNVKTPRR